MTPSRSAPRIVVWPRLPMARAETVAALRQQTGIELSVTDSLEALLELVREADALVLHSAPLAQAQVVVDAIVAAQADAGGRLRWLHFLTAGRDGFEAAGLPKEIQVTHVAGASAPAVAEHALALLLALGRRLPEAVSAAQARRWDRASLGTFTSLEGRRVAVVGAGAIGREISLRLRGFGALPIGLARAAKVDPAFEAVRPIADLHAVLGECDAALVAVPLAADTRHLFDAAAFAAMPRGARFVNVARGAVVDQAALCAVLESGHLGGAGLDVADPEPPPADDRLWRCPNLLLTPHVAADGSPATARRIAEGTAENVRRFAAGEPLLGLAIR